MQRGLGWLLCVWVCAPAVVEANSVSLGPLSRALRAREGQLQPCYRAYLRRHALKPMSVKAGKVILRLLLVKGRIQRATVGLSHFSDARFHRCLLKVARGWTMPHLYRGTRRTFRPCLNRELKRGKTRCYDIQRGHYFYGKLAISYPFGFRFSLLGSKPSPTPMQVLRRMQPSLRRCVEKGLKRAPKKKLRGGLVLKLSSKGRVLGFSLKGAPQVSLGCIEKLLRRARFPRSRKPRQLCWPLVGLSCKKPRWISVTRR